MPPFTVAVSDTPSLKAAWPDESGSEKGFDRERVDSEHDKSRKRKRRLETAEAYGALEGDDDTGKVLL